MRLALALLAAFLVAGCVRPVVDVCAAAGSCVINVCTVGKTCTVEPLDLKVP